MNNTFKHSIVGILFFVCLVSNIQIVFAENNFNILKEPQKVRIGFYHIEGYNEINALGERSGYGYEVLQAMKLYANWSYEYLGFDKGWADIQQMILDGQIDMVISAVKTPEREKLFDFSERFVSQSGSCLLVKASNSKYSPGQYQFYNGMRIGFIEKSSQIKTTEKFAKEKGFSYIPYFYKTSNELEQAILSGKDVDAIVTSNMRIISGTRTLDLFAMQNVHAMVKKGNTKLLKQINYSLEQINLFNSSLYDSLYKKYYSSNMEKNIFFSPDEINFLNKCKTNNVKITAALVSDMSPYSYFVNGKPTGILFDISSEIIRRTGLDIEIVYCQNESDYRRLIESNTIDIRLAAIFNYNSSENLSYKLTKPYYSTDVSRITKKGYEGEIKTIAITRDSSLERYCKLQLHNNEKIIVFDSVADCVSAILKNECDALFLYTRSAQEVVYLDQTNRLTSVIMPSFSTSFSLGIRDNLDLHLASLLEKATNSLSIEDIDNIVFKYTNFDERLLSFVGMIYDSPFVIIVIVIAILLLIFVLIMYFYTAKKQKLEEEKNKQLEQALFIAKEASSAKSIFMSRMSHEIRTPLNAIIGYNAISTKVLESAKNESSYKIAIMKVLDCINKTGIASKHLLTVINDVLDMSAIESGKIKISHEAFDFKKLVSSITILFFSQAKEKGINFEMNFSSLTEEWYVGDEMRINQIVTNLLSNAIKFTPKNGKILCRIWQDENINDENINDEKNKKNSYIYFEVKDTGIGMSQEFLKNIWNPFEQADSSISRRFGGTGLGLSITKNLVDILGGTISVSSQINVGSVFKICLPFERMKQPVIDKVCDFTNTKVLVVDDDQSTCDYLLTLFDRCGCTAFCVNSGVAAIEAIKNAIEQNNPFNVCFIDWQMPEMNGLDTIVKIKEIDENQIPIIVISAYDFSEIALETKKLGVFSFVSKPLFQSTVFDLLANICGKDDSNKLYIQKVKTNDFNQAKILFAEDNVMNMEIAITILSSWNISVDKVYNGEEAVNMFCSSPEGTYKAILMDVHMPQLDGYNATKQIRASNHNDAKTIPIIAMTADAFSEDVAEAINAGMNAHIAKPIDVNVLLEVLQKYIPYQS